jgi:hypothetical protein
LFRLGSGFDWCSMAILSLIRVALLGSKADISGGGPFIGFAEPHPHNLRCLQLTRGILELPE